MFACNIGELFGVSALEIGDFNGFKFTVLSSLFFFSFAWGNQKKENVPRKMIFKLYLGKGVIWINP